MASFSEEEWRPIPGFDEMYQVSNLGRVYSGHKGGRLVGSILSTGYHVASLRENKRPKLKFIHHLVAEAFIGPRPLGEVVRHKDGDKNNNRASNLHYGTYQDNAMDTIEHGRHAKVNQTHCKHGHEFTQGNTYVTPQGHRDCRICRHRRRLETYERTGK